MNRHRFYFDMDNTLNLLFKIPDWAYRLNKLHDATVYFEAPPRRKWDEICFLMQEIRAQGHEVNILSWCSWGTEKHGIWYEECADQKRKWLEKYCKFIDFDHVFLLPYGVPKPSATELDIEKFDYNIIFDDCENIRKDWKSHGPKYIAYDSTRSLLVPLRNCVDKVKSF